MENRVASAAKALLDARRSGFRLEGFADDCVPQDLETAYALQAKLVESSGEGIGGWKVAAGTGSEPLCSPILSTAYRSSDDILNVTGAMATLVEAEVAVRFASDLPPREKPYSEEEVYAAIAAFHPSLEILGTRFNPKLEVPRLLVVGDLQNNSAVVVGAPAEKSRDIDLSRLGITLTIGDQRSTIETGPPLADALSALTWLANGRAREFSGFKAGQVVITGSRINAPVGAPGDSVSADFGALGTVSLRLV